jgi:8-oxo-dGTP pyrophosphatase MutT (NUDIX family)
VIVVREGQAGLEVLLAQRNPAVSFMGGAWVFPGGAVQAGDDGFEGCALRELEEEAKLRLEGPKELTPFSHWITPAEVAVRFDTRFYLAEAPADADPRPDCEECVAVRWLTPAAALDAHRRGELALVFPTIKHLERLATFDSVAHAQESARASEIVPIQPRVVVSEGDAQVRLPGEPGYDD